MGSNGNKPQQTVKGQGFQLSMTYILTYGAGVAWFPFLPLYLEKSGLTSTQAGFVFSLLSVMMFVALPFWGIGADRWGRRNTMLLTLTVSSFALVGILLGNTFVFYVGWMVLFAIIFNPVPPLLDSLTLDYVERKQKLSPEKSGTFGQVSYGKLRMFGSVGWLAFGPIVGSFIEGRDFGLLFPIAAGLYLVSCIFVFQIRQEKSAEGSLAMNWQNLLPVLKNRQLLIFLFIIFLVAIASMCIQTFYAVYLDEIGASSSLIGWAFSVEGISELPFYFIAIYIIKRLGLQKTLIITLLVAAIRMLLYSFISTPVIAVMVEVTHGISFALFFVTIVEYVNYLVPSEWRATGQSLLWAFYYGIGAIVGNIWAGFLIDKYSAQSMFRVNGILLIVVLLIAAFVLLPRKEKKISADESR
jgi:PPP family 3-phenylpropionic acid transporter